MVFVGPFGVGGHGHEDRLRAAAGVDAEFGAFVPEEIEFHVAAAAEELPFALFGAEFLVAVGFCEFGVGWYKEPSDILGKGKNGFLFGGVLATQMIKKDPANATGFVAVGEEEVFVAPFFEAGIVFGIVAVTNGFHVLVKLSRLRLIDISWRHINPTAKPILPIFHLEIADVHMDNGYKWILRMQDNGNTGSVESCAFGQVELLADLDRHGSVYMGDIHPAFLNQVATCECAGATTAALGTGPQVLVKGCSAAVKGDEAVADVVLQGFEEGEYLIELGHDSVFAGKIRENGGRGKMIKFSLSNDQQMSCFKPIGSKYEFAEYD